MSSIVEAISNAVKSGLDHDWVNMGTCLLYTSDAADD